ncbi:MAG: molecular chaperone, partial [Fusobacterium mortiferum]
MKKIIGILFILITGISYSLSFTVYPTKFDVDYKKVGVYEVEIINNTLEPLRIEIFPEADKEFGEDYNVNKNITIVPKNIFLKPGGTQLARFRFKPDTNVKDGQYKSNLIFREIPSEIKTEAKTEEKVDTLVSSIKFITEMAIPVYLTTDNIRLDGEVKNVEVIGKGKNLLIKCDTNSKGNSSIELLYSLEILDTKEKLTGI